MLNPMQILGFAPWENLRASAPSRANFGQCALFIRGCMKFRFLHSSIKDVFFCLEKFVIEIGRCLTTVPRFGADRALLWNEIIWLREAKINSLPSGERLAQSEKHRSRFFRRAVRRTECVAGPTCR